MKQSKHWNVDENFDVGPTHWHSEQYYAKPKNWKEEEEEEEEK